MLKIHAGGKLSSIIMKLLKIKLSTTFILLLQNVDILKSLKEIGLLLGLVEWPKKPSNKTSPTISLPFKNINYYKHGNIFMQFYALFICYINSTFTINSLILLKHTEM